METISAPPLVPSRAGARRVFFRSFLDFFATLPNLQKRFWTLVITVGALTGLAAAGLVDLLYLVDRLAWPAGLNYLDCTRHATPLRRFVVVAGAGALTTLIAYSLRRPLGGHGTAGILEAIWTRRGQELPLPTALLRATLTVVVVQMGTPLGREGAVLAAGAAVAGWLARKLRVSEEQTRILIACGAASGIASIYNAPIGGALFGLEVLLGSFALELFGPIVVSSVTATLIARVLITSHPRFVIPHYELLHPRELVIAILAAPLLGAAAALYSWVVEEGARLASRLPRALRYVLPTLGMIPVALLATRLPEIMGNGYDAANLALLGGFTVGMLALLPFAKLAGTTVAAASGVPGAMFTPSLYYGAMLGALVGHAAERLWPGVAAPGAYALLGMGAVLAGTTHAAVSAMLVVFEMTGDYDVILPLMLTCFIAAATSKLLVRESIYTAPLARRHVRLPEPPRPGWLRRVHVATVMRADATSVAPHARFDEVVARLLLLDEGHDLYVADGDGRLRGVVLLDDVKRSIEDVGALPMIVAADIMRPTKHLRPTAALDEAAACLAAQARERLPVVDDNGRLLGTVAKSSLLGMGRY